MTDPKQDAGQASNEAEMALDASDDASSSSSSSSNPRPKAYILHRTQGKGRSHPIPEGESSSSTFEEGKPPCGVCWVPPPVYWLSGILEQNCFCEAFGRIGCFGHDSFQIRRNILLFGLVANVLSFILSIAACFSLSLNFNHIVSAGFSKGVAYIPELDVPTSRIWIGLRAVAIRNFEGMRLLKEDFVQGDQVIEFDAFCGYVGEGLEYYMDPEECDSCAEASGGLMTAVLMATLLTLPNIFTDILRMYPNYDLNCQKFFGSVLNLASAASSLYAYKGYANQCFRAFFDQDDGSTAPPIDMNNATAMNILVTSVMNRDPSVLSVSFLWRPGNGLVCIVLATFLKAFDIIAMLLIPTPDIAHRRSLQEEYEALYGEKKDNSSHSQEPIDKFLGVPPETNANESRDVDAC